MRSKIFALSVITTMFYCSLLAAENVYVDLSALDNLEVEFEAAEPLMPNSNLDKKVPPVKKTLKAAAKKTPPKVITPIKVVKPKKAIEPKKPSLEAKPVVELKAEIVVPAKEIVPEKAEVKVVKEPLIEEKKLEVKKIENTTEPVVDSIQPQEAIAVPVESKIEPLIPESVSADPSKAEILFADDSYELTAQEQTKLTQVVKHFENVTVNKILILAYNFDGGESLFKKKRLSLNRAVEIRSYLLNMGYKNFSIKIVNTQDRSMNNIAEVSEMK